MKIEYFSLFPKFSDNSTKKEKKEKFAGLKDFGVKQGDIWELGGEHILFCGSCCEKDNVDFIMKNKHAKLLFTSPPYSDMRTYNGCDISIDYIKKFIYCFKDYVDLQCINLGYKMKNGSIIPYWNQYIDYAMQECGLKFLAMNIWDKINSSSVSSQTHYTFPLSHELILVFGKSYIEINKTIPKKCLIINAKKTKRRMKDGSVKYTSTGDTSNPLKKMGSVQSILPNMHFVSRNFHPATFPIRLPMEYIKSCSNEGDYIIEPFAGSGTTILASDKLGRKCIAFEISEEYCNVILNLYEYETKKHVILAGNYLNKVA